MRSLRFLCYSGGTFASRNLNKPPAPNFKQFIFHISPRSDLLTRNYSQRLSAAIITICIWPYTTYARTSSALNPAKALPTIIAARPIFNLCHLFCNLLNSLSFPLNLALSPLPSSLTSFSISPASPAIFLFMGTIIVNAHAVVATFSNAATARRGSLALAIAAAGPVPRLEYKVMPVQMMLRREQIALRGGKKYSELWRRYAVW